MAGTGRPVPGRSGGDGMFNLEGFVRPAAIDRALGEIKPVMDTLSFIHQPRAQHLFQEGCSGPARRSSGPAPG